MAKRASQDIKNKTSLNLYKLHTMKKSPIKVIIRMRPTSNFAHKSMQID